MLIRDDWLAAIFGYPVFKVVVNSLNSNRLYEINNLMDRLSLVPAAFVYAIVPPSDLDSVAMFQKAGWRLVDTRVTLEKRIRATVTLDGGISIRRARVQDCVNVIEIAIQSVQFSRFHLDPDIPNETADTIHREWVTNFFRGKRGDELLVAESRGKIVGFLLLLFLDNSLVVDLIAVDKLWRRANVASSMIFFALDLFQDKVERIKAGTQIANLAAVRLYEKLGFQSTQFEYIFHFCSTATANRVSCPPVKTTPQVSSSRITVRR